MSVLSEAFGHDTTRSRSALGLTATGLLFVLAYLALDRLSFVHALYGVAITPWNPQHGLALALLLVGGLAHLPAVFVAPLLSSSLLPTVAVPLAAKLAASIAIAAGYGVAAVVLRRGLGLDLALSRARDVVALLAVSVVAAAAVALAVVGTFVLSGVVPADDFAEAAAQYWIGDAIGAAVTTPLALLLYARRGGASDDAPRRPIEIALQAASVIAALIAIFAIDEGSDQFKLFYLVFLPVIWISARHGLRGAAWSVLAVQLGLILALELVDQTRETVRAFQLWMFAVTATGLLLGAVVSERRRAEHAVRAGEARLHAILAAAPDGVVTIEPGGEIEQMNPAAEALLGISGQDAAGRPVGSVLPAPELRRHLADASAPGWETVARRADGRQVPIELTIGSAGEGPDRRFILILRDVSRRKQAEARAREHEAELAHVSRLSVAGEMASSLAHELNQPLTAIMAYAQGCRRLLGGVAGVPDPVRAGFDAVVQQAERAGAIIQRLREFLREGTARRSTVAVDEIVREALGLAEIEAAQNAVAVRVEIAPDLPMVVVDRIQIEQVLVNLVRNAVDAIVESACPERDILITAGRRDELVEICVADTGPGVSPEIAERLFQPFVSSKPRGMGLGLSISRTIIEAHQGTLSWQKRDRGAAFLFTLPGAETA
jgi:two-component system sensor kinase FixL